MLKGINIRKDFSAKVMFGKSWIKQLASFLHCGNFQNLLNLQHCVIVFSISQLCHYLPPPPS